jgi:hypothetical protein
MLIGSFKDVSEPSIGGRISIARYAPRGFPKGWRGYSRLAPGPWFNKVDVATYEGLYAAQLATLDPATTYVDLVKLAAGSEPILLCWEETPVDWTTNPCHRYLVAKWFEKELGIVVRQLDWRTFDPTSTTHVDTAIWKEIQAGRM